MIIKTALMVEDSEPDQFLNSRALKDFDDNIEVLQAYDGEEALDILRERNGDIDIIFLDINMPGMNGFEFLDAYKSEHAHNNMVVIMLTSSAQEKDIQKSRDYSFVKEYLVKPLNAEVITELIEKF